MPAKYRRRQTRRQKNSSPSNAEIFADIGALILLLIFLGSALIVFFPQSGGSFGSALRSWLIGLLGIGAFGVPAVILLLGITLLPLQIRRKTGFWTVKLTILLMAFSLFLGSLGGKWEDTGGLLGTYFRELLKEPYLGVFYPLILGIALVGLIIVFSGRAFIVPLLRAIEKTLSELKESSRTKEAEKEAGSYPSQRDDAFSQESHQAWMESTSGKSILPAEAEQASVETKEEAIETFPSDKEAHIASRKTQLRLVTGWEGYKLPPLELLEEAPFSPLSEEALRRNAQIIERTLSSFSISAQVLSWEVGPRVTRYELKIGPGINVNRLHSLSDNLALELAVPAVRLETPIPGKSAVGIEVPNSKFNKISLRSLLESTEMRSTSHPLAFPVGRDLAGKPVIGNIHHMHHLLIAGSTGSGKSVCINSMLVSLLYRNTPETVRFILIDPKRVELSVFKGIPHLATPIVHTINEAQTALRWVVAELEDRLSRFEEAGVRNIDGFNERVGAEEALPFILVVIDELADLIKSAGPVFERLIARIAHLARAAGIHLVVATQRPDTTVITGNIKMNIPSRISFAVVSQIDSRTILDMPGAEKLLGSGDMLYFPVGIPKPIRVQGAWVRDDEVKRVVDFVGKQAEPAYLKDIIEFEEGEEELEGEQFDTEELDPLYSQAYDIVVGAGRASTSLLQRRLKIGYNRAARIMEQMERMGVVSPADHQGNRELLMQPDLGEEKSG